MLERSELERLLALPTGNFCDANGKYGAMDCNIKPLSPAARLAGPAVTVDCPSRDNWTIHVAMEEAEPGSVLVVDAGGYCNAGHFGEIMATACREKGIAGIVIDGGVRDAAEIIEMGFPVYCRGVSPNGTVKATLGKVNSLIQCGGVAVRAGDIIVADGDGVVVLAKEAYRDVLEKAERIQDKEKESLNAIAQGITTLELIGLGKK